MLCNNHQRPINRSHWLTIHAGNTHLLFKGKYHCSIADLLCYLFGFSCFAFVQLETYLFGQIQTSQTGGQLNSLQSKWVFSDSGVVISDPLNYDLIWRPKLGMRENLPYVCVVCCSFRQYLVSKVGTKGFVDGHVTLGTPNSLRLIVQRKIKPLVHF